MYKKVLFCIPPFPNRYGLPTHPHTGIGYLSETLSQNEVENEVIDLRLGYKTSDVIKKINFFEPELIGVTMMSYYHNLAYKLVSEIKNLGHKVIVGGPHISTLGKQSLEECGADFAVKMEGEETLLALCQGKKPQNIEGLIYREGEKVLENPGPSPIEKLDEIPYPTYEKFELPKYARKRIPIITTRGCPYHCTFCPIAVVMGRCYRKRRAENVVEEVNYWYTRGYREFDFQDDNFTYDKTRVYEVCNLIEENRLTGLEIICGNGIRADFVDKPILQRMYEVGFRSLAFGVESANPQVLRKVKKGEKIETIENAIKAACEIGYDVALFFIVGLPGETLATLENSIKFAYKYPVSIASFYNLIPFPGTELYNWIEENNYFIRQPKEYLNHIAHGELEPVFETPDFSLRERKQALARTQKVAQDIRRRDMERKLNNTKIGKVVAYLVYSPVINNMLLNFIQRSGPFKKILNYILYKLKLRVYI